MDQTRFLIKNYGFSLENTCPNFITHFEIDSI